MQRRFLAVAVCGAMIFAFTNCTKSKSESGQAAKGPVKEDKKPVQGPAWSLTLTSKCASEAADQCVAAYGFSVSADGKYHVGPGPSGQTRSDLLSSDEMASISTLLTQMMSTVHMEADHAETCVPVERAMGSYSVVLTRLDQENTIIRSDDQNLCYQTASAEDAEALHNAIVTLAESYYRLPFPNACLDAIDAVQLLYPELQSCNTAADCGYFTPAMDIVPPDSNQYIVTDDCSMLKPLVVGNIGAVINSQAKLVAAIENAQNVCGQQMVNAECSGVSGFDTSVGAAVCENHTCRISPSAQQ